jgi:HSP20 family protein
LSDSGRAPGVNPDDLNVTFENNTLTVRGELRDENESGDRTHHVREIRYGSFVRSVMLPGDVNADTIEAHCDNGLVTLRLPKTEQARPRRITVRAAGQGNGQSTAPGNGQRQGTGTSVRKTARS